MNQLFFLKFFVVVISVAFTFSCGKSDGVAPGTDVLTSTSPASGGGGTGGSGSGVAPASANLYGRVSDSANGNFLANTTVTVYSGGSVVSTATTDGSGNYTFTNLAGGSYTVDFTSSNYVSITGIQVSINGSNINLNESLSRPTLAGQIRIVLTWYANLNTNVVKDIDSYLSSSASSSKVFYSARSVTWADGSSATLDNDVSNYLGPETITLSNISNSATYHYYFNNYSASTNCSAIGLSGVHVDVYSGSEIINSYDVLPDSAHGGVIYEVFQIVNGQIVDVNQFNNSLSATKTNLTCP